MVEEALRLLSIPGETGTTVFFIRHARFPDIYDGEAGWSYAERVNRLCQRLLANAIYFRSAGAGSADAVFARSAVEPWIAMAERMQREQLCHEWFWPSAIRGFPWQLHSAGPTVDLLIELRRQFGLSGLIDFFEQAAPSVIESVLSGLTEALVRELSFSDISLTSRALPGTAAFTQQLRPAAISALDQLPREWRAISSRWIGAWTITDIRSAWLGSLVFAMFRPQATLHNEFASQVAVFLQATQEHAYVNRALTDENLLCPATESKAAATTADSDDAQEEKAARSVFTRYAGLFFLLRLLDRFGMSDTLQSHPELIDSDFVIWLLRNLMQTARVPPEDAVATLDWLGWTLPPQPDFSLTLHFKPTLLPLPWRGIRSKGMVWSLQRIIRAWTLSVRRHTRRLSGLSLNVIAKRFGNYTATRTHLTVQLPQSGLDLQIRRAGLDVDPGWLAWLGKIVEFQYNFETVTLPADSAIRRTRGRNPA